MKLKLTRTLMAALALFGMAAPAMALSDANAFAYDIRVNKDAPQHPVVTYKLNAPAEAVSVVAYDNGKEVARVAGGTEAGAHSATIDLSAIWKAEITVKIEVKTAKDGSFWGSAGTQTYESSNQPITFAINNDPNSDHFGQMVVGYQGNNNVRSFNADFSATGAATQPIGNSGTGDYDRAIGRLRYTADGRLFALAMNQANSGLYELDLNTLNSKGKVIDGVQGAGLAFTGTGSNTKVAVLTTTATANAHIQNDLRIYNLNSPGSPIKSTGAGTGLTGNMLRNAFSQVAFDPDGQGVFVSSYAANPSATDRVFTHASINDLTSNYEGHTAAADNYKNTKAFAISSDGRHIAVSKGNQINFYTLSVSGGGAPNIEAARVGGINAPSEITDIAFDYANNVYMTCIGTGVVTYRIKVKNGDLTCVVPAPASQAYKYDIKRVGTDGKVLLDAVTQSAGYQNLEISWTADNNSLGQAPYQYTVLRNGVAVADGLTGTSYIDKNLAVGTYAYKVQAFYKDANGEPYYVESPTQNGYIAREGIPEGTDGGVTITEAKTYAGRNMVSLKWTRVPNALGYNPYAYDLYRDGQPVMMDVNAASYIDVNVPDGMHTYKVVAFYKNSDESVYKVESEPRSLAGPIKLDAAMTSYTLEVVYNHHIYTEAEMGTYGADPDNTFKAEGTIFHNARTPVSDGAPGDVFRQGVFYNGKWYISQLTNHAANGTNKSGKPSIGIYSETAGYYGGIVSIDADDPLNTAKYEEVNHNTSMVNQSLAISPRTGRKYVRENNAGGTQKYFQPTFTLGSFADGVDTGADVTRWGLPWDFYDHSKQNAKDDAGNRLNLCEDWTNDNEYSWGMDDEDVNKSETARAKFRQYYRNQFLNADQLDDEYDRVFFPMNGSRDLYVALVNNSGVKGAGETVNDSRLFRAPDELNESNPDATPGTENYAIPIEGRKDFLHVMRSNAVYYVDWESGHYTKILNHPSEVSSSSGITFNFNHELFYIHPTCLMSNNPGHFRIDMPERTWNDVDQKFDDVASANFEKLIPMASYAQTDLPSDYNFDAGNSNGTWFGIENYEKDANGNIKKDEKGNPVPLVDELGDPCVYIYQYVPGVRFAKYKFKPYNAFPPVVANLQVKPEYTDDKSSGNWDAKDPKYEHIGKYYVEFGFRPSAFDNEERKDYKRYAYDYVLYDPNGKPVASGRQYYTDGDYENGVEYTFRYEPEDGKGVGRNDQYHVVVTPVYQSTSDDYDFRKGGPGEAMDVKTYEPKVGQIYPQAFVDNGGTPNDPSDDIYRVDLRVDDFDHEEPVSKYTYEYSPDGGNIWLPLNPYININGEQHCQEPGPDTDMTNQWTKSYMPGDYDFTNDPAPANYVTDENGNKVPDADPCAAWYVTKNNPEGYIYRITAEYAADNDERIKTQASSTGAAGAPTQTGVNDIVADANTGVKVYPVPATDVITVESAQAIDNVKIVSLSGALVKDLHADGNTTVTMNIADLSAGVYVVVVNNTTNVRLIVK